MRLRTFIRISLVSLSLLGSIGVGATVLPKRGDLAAAISIKAQSTDANEQTVGIVVEFDKPLDQSKVENARWVDGHLQLEIHGAKIMGDPLFADLGSKNFPKAAIFTSDSASLNLRIFVATDKKTSDFETSWSPTVVVSGTQLLVSMGGEPTVTPESVVAKDVKTEDHTSASTTEVLAGSTTDTSFFNVLRKKNLLKNLGIGALSLFVFVLLTIPLKKAITVLSKSRKESDQDAKRLMQVLDQISVNRNTKLSLMEIAGEKLLFSVTPQGVQLMTHMNQSKAAAPQVIYANGMPQGLDTPRLERSSRALTRSQETLKQVEESPMESKVGFNKYLEQTIENKDETPQAKKIAQEKIQNLIRKKLKEMPGI